MCVCLDVCRTTLVDALFLCVCLSSVFQLWLRVDETLTLCIGEWPSREWKWQESQGNREYYGTMQRYTLERKVPWWWAKLPKVNGKSNILCRCAWATPRLLFSESHNREIRSQNTSLELSLKRKIPPKILMIPSVYPPVNLLHKHCWSRCCCHRRKMLQLFLHKPPWKLFPQAVKVITLTCIVYGS